MKAITYSAYGKESPVIISDLPKPVPKHNEVLVKIKAASINPIDFLIKQGMLLPITGFRMPKRMGIDFAGIIESTGEEVFGWMPYHKSGTFAEYIAAPKNKVHPKPKNISFQEAAGLAMTGAAALKAITEIGKVQKKSKIFINGITGGVGHMALQIAKAHDCVVDGSTASSDIELAQKLGARNAIDYTKQSIYDLAEQYDIIFDTVAKLNFSKCKNVMRSNGIYITTKPTSSVIIGYVGNIAGNKRYHILKTFVTSKHLSKLSKLSTENKCKVHIGQTINFDDADAFINTIKKQKPVPGKKIIVL